MFNMKFHADERSMDMTRRRRWHRKMVPSAEESLLTSASGSSMANTDIIFRMQSQVQAPTSDASANKGDQPSPVISDSPSSKEMKIELNAPRMYLAFKSKCFPRSCAAGSMVDVLLEAYFYELRVYMYQARNLLSMDHDSLSGE